MNLMNILLMAAPAEGAESNPYGGFIMMGLIILVFYFFFIRPQQKKSKDLRKFRESLQKGDNIVTIGGIHGKVNEVKDNYVVISVGEGMRLKMNKEAITKDGAAGEQEIAQKK